MGGARSSTSVAFVSAGSVGAVHGYGLSKRIEAVKNCRRIGKRDMKHNDATPVIKVDPETYHVTADGEHLVSRPAESLNLAQRYFLF
jgi:urease alpha subunit